MTDTALGIITSAMRKAGILTKTESPSADEANDGLELLNDLMASMANDSLIAYANVLESFPLSGGVSDYTIGVGGTFNTSRPIDIVSAYVRIASIDYSVQVIKDQDYADIDLKSIQSIPYFLNYTNAYPLATIKFYPVPSAAWTLYLLSVKPFTEFTLSSTVDLPPGWSRYLKNQMALELAPEYGQSVPPETASIAADALGLIKRAAARVKSMDANVSPYAPNTIYSGYYR